MPLLENGDVYVIIHPARGYYRHRQADVMAWTGYVYADGRAVYDIGSWDTVTRCLRGFTVRDCRSGEGAIGKTVEFEVDAIALSERASGCRA